LKSYLGDRPVSAEIPYNSRNNVISGVKEPGDINRLKKPPVQIPAAGPPAHGFSIDKEVVSVISRDMDNERFWDFIELQFFAEMEDTEIAGRTFRMDNPPCRPRFLQQFSVYAHF